MGDAEEGRGWGGWWRGQGFEGADDVVVDGVLGGTGGEVCSGHGDEGGELGRGLGH